MSSAYACLNRLKAMAFALFVLAFLLLFNIPASQAQTNCAQADVPQAECEALLALYNRTQGNYWIDNTNWTQTNKVCEWYGISCENGHVVAVSLHVNDLVGTLPLKIGNLTSLRVLTLWGNQLTGLIPPQITNLMLLRELDLSWNKLTGPIPAQIGNLKELKILNLGINQLSGTIPPEIFNLSALEILDLGSNQFTGPIPSEIGNLSALNTLILWGNKFIGTIPIEIGSLSQLEMLLLGHSDLSGNIPIEITNLSKLGVFHLEYTLITGPIPPELGNLTNLVSLSLLHNRLTGSIPPQLGNLTSLTWLQLWSNQLGGPIPPELGNLESLNTLSLGRNRLNGAIPESFTRLVNASVDINHNALNVRGLSSQLNAFLNSKADPAWRTTQIAPPADVHVSATTAWSVTLRWTPVGNLTKPGYYEIGYSTTSGGPYTFDPANRTVDRKANSFRVRGLITDTPYYFVVRAVRSGAVTFASANSAEIQAIPVAVPNTLPTAPVLVSPAHQTQVIDQLPVLSWTPNALTEQVYSYTVTIFNKNNTVLKSFIVHARQCSDVCTLDLALRDITFKPERYKWQVTARNIKGVRASEMRSFIIQIPGKATPLAPIDATTAPLPTFQWTLAGIPTHYRLEIYDARQARVYQSAWLALADVGCAVSGETCTFVLPTALPNQTYTWQVLSRSTQYPGLVARSALKSFRVHFPQTPLAINPINEVVVTTEAPDFSGKNRRTRPRIAFRYAMRSHAK